VRYKSTLANVPSGDLKMKPFWPNYHNPMPVLGTENSLIWRLNASLIDGWSPSVSKLQFCANELKVLNINKLATSYDLLARQCGHGQVELPGCSRFLRNELPLPNELAKGLTHRWPRDLKNRTQFPEPTGFCETKLPDPDSFSRNST